MADKNLGVRIDVNTTTVKSAKAELRELKKQLTSGELTGLEFQQAAERAGELQDRIADVNQRVKNLSNDTPLLNTLTSAATGIAGGFTAAVGAVGLFTEGNDELQKQLLKVQSALSLLTGIQAVANTLNKDSALVTGLATAATKAYTLATTGSTVATRLLGQALLALPFVAVAAGLVALIVYWDEITTAVKEFIGVQNEATEAVENYALTEEQRSKIQDIAFQRNKKRLADELALLKAQGASRDELDAKRQANIEAEIRGLNLLRQTSKDVIEQEKIDDEIRALQQEQTLIREQGITDKRIENEKRLQEERKKQAEIRRRDEEEEEKRRAKFAEDTSKQIKELLEKEAKEEAERRETERQELFDQIRINGEILAENRKRQLEAEQRQAEARKQIEQDTFTALNAIAALAINDAQELQNVQKGITLTQIGFDTASAISSLVRNSEGNPLNLLTAGAAGQAQFVAGLARILTNIAKAKQLLGGGGSTPSIQAAQGTGQTRQQSQPNFGLLDRDAIQRSQQQTVKVVVVESEISSVQNRVKVIEQRSSIR